MENNNDFKYVIQDTGHLYFGKELTYQEIMDREDVPFKFKAIVSTYVVKDTPLDVKITEHVLKVSRDAFSYRIFEQLKMEVRIFYAEEKKGFGGKMKKQWIHKTCALAKFQEQYGEAVLNGEAMIEDISVSKLALMTISI